jgi:hypothetical protein
VVCGPVVPFLLSAFPISAFALVVSAFQRFSVSAFDDVRFLHSAFIILPAAFARCLADIDNIG